jgi:hypothetical protein
MLKKKKQKDFGTNIEQFRKSYDFHNIAPQKAAPFHQLPLICFEKQTDSPKQVF